MVTLLAPAPDTMVFRRSKSELSGPGAWHLAKDGRVRITACGDFISHLHEVDISTLTEIPLRELCQSCRQAGNCDGVLAVPEVSSAR
jgi:hypothetical protein